jgi:hypothetical protein
MFRHARNNYICIVQSVIRAQDPPTPVYRSVNHRRLGTSVLNIISTKTSGWAPCIRQRPLMCQDEGEKKDERVQTRTSISCIKDLQFFFSRTVQEISTWKSI